jgi:hypothetical protein
MRSLTAFSQIQKTGVVYYQRKIDVEPIFGFLKANLGFTRFSIRGKSKAENGIGLALMAVNLRKYVARSCPHICEIK